MNDNIAALPPLRDVIAAHGLSAIKGLGQHFLLDLNLTAKIARAAGGLKDCAVIEVGPGPGGLTRAILEADAARLIAIERDERCIAALQPLIEASAGRMEMVEADALKTDAVARLREQGWTGPIKVVANLPYNVGTALILNWLERPAELAAITVLVQKEVAERLAAPPRSKAYGRLSVLAQWLCEVDLAFDIGPRAFTPPPQVTSTVVNLIPRRAPLHKADRAALEAVTKAAFGQRRKMLRASLKALGMDFAPLLEAAGIEPTARAEELDVAAFCRLANAYSKAMP
ncbi:MAG TPA: 16S rRNA (adenine(1518)-N(6)/adenine(1519)-N(6))-dimethyltransferase RsmA [Alphaproteobacteria bacterium]|nr:16S rRNA (adenine(1518)-N(6)/adenine(1519)-N(6))-dimethyltransferase RsmA [Alphaproteobacteria bacterium]